MALFEANGVAINTNHVVSVGPVRNSVQAGNCLFVIELATGKEMQAKYTSKEEAESGRQTLLNWLAS